MSLWSQAFSGVGPARLRNITPDEFAIKMALKEHFGSTPSKTDIPGGRVNIKSPAYRYWDAYQGLEKDFVGIILDKDFLTEEQSARIAESTGGRIKFWKSRSGTPYMAVLDIPFIDQPIYRFPLDLFSQPDLSGDPVNPFWMKVLERGGVIAFPPDVPGSLSGWDNVSSVVRELNDRNIKKLKDAGLLPA